MRDESTVAREILAILKEQLLLDVESPQTDLIETGVLDSVGLVSLILQIEERFDIAMPVDELDSADIRSVQALARLVASQSGCAPPRADSFAAAGAGQWR